ncbi:PDR/VanB family oxidoreductase [Erwinia psidii]|uniref:Oxidoreductase n=1 Tax=Erwinia psidii TaxID=69224 RepID=A0A3N6SKT2_9GAMM|nr:PDR/VanB family oxidoreductase [Erwinia psidii]MCX8957997.1 oxidoreductase [Erwinia psidii]MCX8962605.1 oxidoreductase [Erwinia psidii]MCX8963928.1 oxidoreductase [Erwinia psidii]RQM39421.1 oxidoreductase [Erwinia psidii]
MTTLLNVVVDGIWRQGRHNLAINLVAENGQALPEWQPGAHIDLHLPDNRVRQYSLTGRGNTSHQYQICVAHDKQSRGGSRWIHEVLRPGHTLNISAPRNLFQLKRADKVVLLAAGIGITPLYAMAEALEASGVPFVLHYYIKHHDDAAFLQPLSRVLQHGICKIWSSSEGQSPRTHIADELKSPSEQNHLYLCGPEGFMSQMTETACRAGWLAENIHTEAFKPPAVAEGLSDNNSFTVTLASTGQQWIVPAEKSIAHVLKENGVDVPLSCEMGMCGACLTGVKQGMVDHRDTVQSDREKNAEQQQIALCCSRSLSANLVIDL